jgi:hypothetical protein
LRLREFKKLVRRNFWTASVELSDYLYAALLSPAESKSLVCGHQSAFVNAEPESRAKKGDREK